MLQGYDAGQSAAKEIDLKREQYHRPLRDAGQTLADVYPYGQDSGETAANSGGDGMQVIDKIACPVHGDILFWF